MLEEEVPKRREGRDVSREIPSEAVGPKAKNTKRIKFSKGVGRDWTGESNSWKAEFKHMG